MTCLCGLCAEVQAQVLECAEMQAPVGDSPPAPLAPPLPAVPPAPSARNAAEATVDAEAAGHGSASSRGGDGGGDPGTAARSDPAYDARDPALQLWVAATLYDTAVMVYELVHGPLDEESADHVYREYALLGTALQMPAELWPADRSAFRLYFDATVATLTVDDTVRGVADALLAAEKTPLPIRVAMPLARFVTVALLPPRVRAEFGFVWSLRRERRFRRLARAAAPVYRALPTRLRTAPQRRYLAKLRAGAGAVAGAAA